MQAKILQKLTQRSAIGLADANAIITQIGDAAAPDSNARALIRRALKGVFPNARFN